MKFNIPLIALLFFVVFGAFFIITFALWQGNFFSENKTHTTESSTNNAPAFPTDPETSISFTFAGDAMFGREIGYKFQADNFIKLFENLENPPFWKTDISWINLEGPISDKIIIQDPNSKNLIFNFSKQTIEALRYLKLTTVGLANNHTINQQKFGLAKTKEMLQNANINWNGDPLEINEKSVWQYEKEDIKISLIAANILLGAEGIEDLIQKEKEEKRFVIILPHWGNEYQQKHSQSQEKLASSWISAGADLIIGSHPHVIQDAQIINNKLVFYSLGNFVFDQHFSKETQQGLTISGALTKEKIKIILIPIESKNLIPEILQNEEKKIIVDKICSNIQEYCENDVITIGFEK